MRDSTWSRTRTNLESSSSGSDGGQKVDSGVFALPVGSWVRVVLLRGGRRRKTTRQFSFFVSRGMKTHSKVGVDVPLDDSSDLSLELLHQGSSELGSGLSSSVGFCERGTRCEIELDVEKGSRKEDRKNLPVEGSISVRMYSIGSSSNISSS